MSLRQTVKLELEDGSEVEVTYDGRDLRAWEGSTGKSALGEAMSLTMLTWLGWAAAKRQGLLNGSFDSFDAFDKVCASVQGVADADPPTERPAARTRKTASGS